MSIDSSIAMGVQPMKIESPMNALAQMMQIKHAQQQTQLGELTMQEHVDKRDRTNRLESLLSGDFATPQTRQEAMVKGGFLKESVDYGKGNADAAHLGAQTGKLKAETINLHVTQSRDQLSAINDPQGGAAWLTAMYNNPELAPLVKMSGKTLEQQIAGIPQDPKGFADWKMRSSLGAEKLVQMTMPDANAVLSAKTSTDNNNASNATSRANNAASVGATMRGQNMTDARSRDTNAATMTKPFEVTGPDGTPVLVRQDKQGNISQVEGFGPKAGAGKALTEGQSKAVLFGARMESADKIMSGLAAKGTDRASIGANTSFGVGSIVNATGSDEQQSLNQAQRDFVNAVLRRESGASISPAEFESAQKQYFPQINEGQVVVKQKANSRAIAIRGMQAEIPSASKGLIKEVINGPAKAGGFDDAAKEARYQAFKAGQSK